MEMSKRKHHFVPRFYLHAFKSAPKRINVYNLAQELAIRDASLRDQCYKHRFYGETDELEDKLSRLETQMAPVVRSILRGVTIPKRGSEAHALLIVFIALQLQRTAIAATLIDSGMDKLVKKAFERDPRAKGLDFDSFKVRLYDPVLVSLANFGDIAYAIEDMEYHLVRTSGNQFFITSDNPVFKYNRYCEGLREIGITGALSRGLQIFVPLSPELLLMLYDGWVYKVDDKRSKISHLISNRDVEMLNMLQLVSADENLYFADWNRADCVRDLVRRASRFRNPDPVTIHEFAEVSGDQASSLLHLFHQIPNLKLDLSFVSFRRKARRVPLIERGHKYRKEALPTRSDLRRFDVGSSRKRTFMRRP